MTTPAPPEVPPARRRPAANAPVSSPPFRITPLGATLVVLVVVVASRPPTAVDGALSALVWAALVGTLVLGAAWPLVAIRTVRAAVRSPDEATVGEGVELALALTGRLARLDVRVLDPAGPWHRSAAPGSGTLAHRADRRGVFDSVRIEVRTTAPLGVLAARRVLSVPLARPVEVGPRPLNVGWHPQLARVPRSATHASTPLLDGDVARSVRPYVLGDPAHLVHWPSSARLGSLVVRELEPPAPLGLAVVLDLRGPSEQAELAASYAAGAVRAVLASGGVVLLATCEADGPVAGVVASAREAGRRLARAVPGPPAPVPDGWTVVELGAGSGPGPTVPGAALDRPGAP